MPRIKQVNVTLRTGQAKLLQALLEWVIENDVSFSVVRHVLNDASQRQGAAIMADPAAQERQRELKQLQNIIERLKRAEEYRQNHLSEINRRDDKL